MTQFQVEHWSAEGLCSNPQALIHVINEMGVAQRRAGNKPIVVHGRLVLYSCYNSSMDPGMIMCVIPRSHSYFSIVEGVTD